MKNKIEEILKNSYTNCGEFDESKATKELLDLFSVMNSNTKKQMEKYKNETVIEKIARLGIEEYYS